MNEERIIIHRRMGTREEDATGCYCPAAHGFCPKFTAPSERFFQDHCEKCHVYGEFHERQERVFKELAEKKRVEEKELADHPRLKRTWTAIEPDGNIGAKAYE